MNDKVNRRGFFQKSILASSAAAAFSFEEQVLRRAQASQEAASASKPKAPAKSFPRGKLGKLSISRMICGGNLISGFAHSRDLIYVSPLLKQYFTDEKVFETLALCEAHGINTAILRLDDDTLRILKTYWKERGGKIQWIAQMQDQGERSVGQSSRRSITARWRPTCMAAWATAWWRKGKVDVLGKAVDLIKQQRGRLPGSPGTPSRCAKACEQAGIKPDFYMKTFNSKRYWSAGPMPRNDSVWEETPEETRAFMAGSGPALDRLQGAGRGRHSSARGFPIRLPKRRRLSLRGHVRFPGGGGCRNCEIRFGKIEGPRAALVWVSVLHRGFR